MISFETDFVVFQSRTVWNKLIGLVGRKINILRLEYEIGSFDSEIPVSDFHFFDQSDDVDLILSGLNNIVSFIAR